MLLTIPVVQDEAIAAMTYSGCPERNSDEVIPVL